MTKITAFIKSIFIQNSYATRLESYLMSKSVTSAAEVDYWIREYDRKNYHA